MCERDFAAIQSFDASRSSLGCQRLSALHGCIAASAELSNKGSATAQGGQDKLRIREMYISQQTEHVSASDG